MIKPLNKHHKTKNPFYIFMFICFLIGFLFISLSINHFQFAKYRFDGYYSGDTNNYIQVTYFTDGSEPPSKSEIYIKLLEHVKNNEVQFSIWPFVSDYDVIYQGYRAIPEFLPPLKAGRHLTSEESLSDSKYAVVGKNVAEIGDKISLYDGSTFEVVGVLGLEYSYSIWDDIIIIPLHFMRNIDSSSNNEGVKVRLQGSSSIISNTSRDLGEYFQNLLPEGIIDVSHESPVKTDFHNFSLYLMGSIILIIVSCVNIINLTILSVYNRKKEFGIRLSLGATHAYLKKLISSDLYIVGLLSACTALLTQFIASNLFTFSQPIGVTPLHLVILLPLPFIFGFINTRLPLKVALNFEPSDIIKGNTSSNGFYQVDKTTKRIMIVQIFFSLLLFLYVFSLYEGMLKVETIGITVKDYYYLRDYILLVVGITLIGLIGTFSQSVIKRKNEFGIKIALGASPRDIVIGFYQEILIIFIEAAVYAFIPIFLLTLTGDFTIGLVTIIGTIVVVLILTAIVTTYPMYKVLKLEPAELMDK